MTPTKDYTITELEEVTGLSRRTIHFYVQQGIIAQPAGAGGAARYREEHVLRLKLIPLLQQSHLKLSGIKQALDAMDISQMRRLVREARPTVDLQKATDLLRFVRAQARTAPEKAVRPTEPQADMSQFSFAALDSVTYSKRANPPALAKLELRQDTTSPAESWQRLQLAEGVELHLRSDRIAHYQTLIAEIRKLFAKYQA